MSWRTGAELFCETWPLIAAKVKPDKVRAEFVEELLSFFIEWDVDPSDLEGLDPEVDRALAHLAELRGE